MTRKQAARSFWAVVAILCGSHGASMCFTYDSDGGLIWVIGPALLACAVCAIDFASE